MAYGLTMATTLKLAAQLSEILMTPETEIMEALGEITRRELLRVTRNEKEAVVEIVPLMIDEDDDDIDLSLYEGRTAC